MGCSRIQESVPYGEVNTAFHMKYKSLHRSEIINKNLAAWTLIHFNYTYSRARLGICLANSHVENSCNSDTIYTTGGRTMTNKPKATSHKIQSGP
jgi:hypothetical protein